MYCIWPYVWNMRTLPRLPRRGPFDLEDKMSIPADKTPLVRWVNIQFCAFADSIDGSMEMNNSEETVPHPYPLRVRIARSPSSLQSLMGVAMGHNPGKNEEESPNHVC